MKHNLGDTVFWVESSCNYGKSIPCPMCFGKQYVTIILGDESKTEIECGFCSHGIDRPSGYTKTWEPGAIIKSGKITGFTTRDYVRYEVDNKTLTEGEVLTSQDQANAVYLVELEKAKEQAKRNFEEKFVYCKKNQIWQAGYHRQCIERAERTIEWHKYRLGLIKEKSKT